MPNRQFTVTESTPRPARILLSLLQSQLRLPKQECLRMVRDGGVLVNGRRRLQAHEVMEPGDQIEVDWLPVPKMIRSKTKRTNETFSVVYEDAHLLVVMKPASLLTVPTLHREKRTLVSLVTKYLQDSDDPDSEAFCVHRLDRGVSGLVIFAKSLAIAESIRSQFAARKPKRLYVAIVKGVPKRSSATMRSYLATDDNLNRYSVVDPSEGELAITHYRVLHAWEDAAMVEVQLETGRRNQIRVHMAELGHPVVNDPRYRPKLAEHWAWPYPRIALHARSIGFSHPVTGESLAFDSSWPQEFKMFQKHMTKKRDK